MSDTWLSGNKLMFWEKSIVEFNIQRTILQSLQAYLRRHSASETPQQPW